MGNGNRSGLEDGTEKSASASASECDVGLGLRMQHTESFPSRTMMETPHPPLPYHHLNAAASLSDSMGGVGFGGDGGSSGSGSGGPIYYNLSNSNQLACLSDIYDVVGNASVSGGAAALVVPRTFHPFASDSFFKSSSSGRGGGGGGGGMEDPAKVPFTASQRQELERQTNIYKYIMASIPVPPELLLPITKSPSPLPSSHSQSNMSGLDLKFSRSSDPEPWRCRRTDGKKWRCSRDVAPYQKYCERHAHKTRPRSRKPVELQPHNTQTNSNTTNTHPLVNLSTTNKTAHPYQKPIFHIPTLLSGATHAQPRCTEWFMKGDPIPGCNLNQQWQQLMESSSSREGELKSYNEEEHNNRHVSVFQQHYEEEQRQQSMNVNSYIDMDGQRFQNKQPNEHCSSSLLGGLLNTNQTQTTATTRRFIDAWSSAEGEEMDHDISRCSVPSSRRNLPLSSLTLSMSGADNRIEEESANDQMGVSGMMRDLERESESGDGGFKSQWLLNPVPWMGSPPGGPLGEALCLGIASTAKAASNVPSPHDYSTTTSTTMTTSSCSKSSCEDSGHGLHFH